MSFIVASMWTSYILKQKQ